MVDVKEKQKEIAYLSDLAKWIMHYTDIKRAYFSRPFVYMDNETMYTPLIINDEWVKNELDGFKSTIYSTKELDNDNDILKIVKKFVHLLPTITIIPTGSRKEHLQELVLVLFPVYIDGIVNDVLLDLFLNINGKSCMRYKKMYDFFGLHDDEFYENFTFCIITNSTKSKLYGRTWYHRKRDILINTYHSDVKYALTDTYKVEYINNNINRHFYLNEIIYLSKYTKPYKIEGLNMDNLRRCDNCDEWALEDTMIYLDNGNCYCEHCGSEYVAWCSYCEGNFDVRDTAIYRLRHDEFICEHCLAERRIDV